MRTPRHVPTLSMSVHILAACRPAAGTSFGLPELQLGIIPGFGGTQRLPRAVGLQKAAEMMLTSTPIKDGAARKLGLVDEVVPPQQLLEAAKKLALDIACERGGWDGVVMSVGSTQCGQAFKQGSLPFPCQ